MSGESWFSTFWRAFGPIDFYDFRACGFAWFYCVFDDFGVFRWSQRVDCWSSQGFQSKSWQSRFGVLRGDPEAPTSVPCSEMMRVQFWFILLWFLKNVGVSKGSTSCILLILACVYWCLVKVDFRPFEGPSDPSILMIVGRVVLLYFTVVFDEFGVLRWSQRVEFWSSQGFLSKSWQSRFGVLRGDPEAPTSVQCSEMMRVQFCIILLGFLNSLGVSKG